MLSHNVMQENQGMVLDRCWPVQVGPTWMSGEGSTEQSAKFAIYLTAPANTTFHAPYALTITGRAPFSAVSTWNWDASVDSAGKVTPGGITVTNCFSPL